MTGSMLGGAESPLGAIFEAARDPTGPTRFGKIYFPDPGWLARAEPEPALEPDLPIVDAHHHLWNLPGYGYLLPEFTADLQTGHNIVATVFNECHSMYREDGPEEMKPVGEVEFCARIAELADAQKHRTRINAGIVGSADLRLGDRVTPVLEAMVAAGGGRFRGVRHGGAWDPDPSIVAYKSPGPGLYLDPQFRAGVKRLASLGLSLDAWVFHPQIPDVVSLARDCPEATIVLCHMGGFLGYGGYAGKRKEQFQLWKKSMAELARCDNVVVKVGGMMMRLAAFDYGTSPRPATSSELAQLWGPFVQACIDHFGPSRCMVESNFPVDKMGIGYAGLFNTYKRIAAGLSSAEKEQLFSGTAARVYRLALGGVR